MCVNRRGACRPDSSRRAPRPRRGRRGSRRAASGPRRRGAAELRGGAGADDRRGDARAGRAPRPARPRAGDQPRPSAAVAHGLDDALGARVEVALDERGEVRRGAARVGRGAGAVLAGEHARARAATTAGARARAPRRRARPRARCRAGAGSTPPGWRRAAPGRARRAARSRPGRSASRCSWRCRRSAPGRSRRRGRARSASPRAGVVDPGVDLPEVDVVDAEPAQRARRASSSSAPREASTTRSPVAAARCRPWWRSRPRRGRRRRRAASRAAPRTRRRRSRRRCRRRVPPASTKAISWSRASCSSVSRPHVMVPRPEPARRGVRCVRGRAAPCGRSYRRRDRRDRIVAAQHECVRRLGAGSRERVKLGLNLGYWGAGNDADNLAAGPGGRPARLLGGLGGRGVRLRRGDRARLGRGPDRAHRRRLARSSRSRPGRRR